MPLLPYLHIHQTIGSCIGPLHRLETLHMNIHKTVALDKSKDQLQGVYSVYAMAQPQGLSSSFSPLLLLISRISAPFSVLDSRRGTPHSRMASFIFNGEAVNCSREVSLLVLQVHWTSLQWNGLMFTLRAPR
jgi:hypothetical protein